MRVSGRRRRDRTHSPDARRRGIRRGARRRGRDGSPAHPAPAPRRGSWLRRAGSPTPTPPARNPIANRRARALVGPVIGFAPRTTAAESNPAAALRGEARTPERSGGEAGAQGRCPGGREPAAPRRSLTSRHPAFHADRLAVVGSLPGTACCCSGRVRARRSHVDSQVAASASMAAARRLRRSGLTVAALGALSSMAFRSVWSCPRASTMEARMGAKRMARVESSGR